MADSGLIWKTKITGETAYVDMKSPSSYKIDWEDLDKDSYRSVTNGNLIRRVIAKKWYKIGFTFKMLSESDVSKIMARINNANLMVKATSPVFGTGGWVELSGYVSKVSVEKLEAGLGYSMSFNFVQARRGSWQ